MRVRIAVGRGTVIQLFLEGAEPATRGSVASWLGDAPVLILGTIVLITRTGDYPFNPRTEALEPPNLVAVLMAVCCVLLCEAVREYAEQIMDISTMELVVYWRLCACMRRHAKVLIWDSKSAEGNLMSVGVRPRPPYLHLIPESVSATVEDLFLAWDSESFGNRLAFMRCFVCIDRGIR